MINFNGNPYFLNLIIDIHPIKWMEIQPVDTHAVLISYQKLSSDEELELAKNSCLSKDGYND